MTDLKWLSAYSGQTVDELLSLAANYRIDSLVVALEQAIGQKAARLGDQILSSEERIVLAVEALEREVNNGGCAQFFVNTPEFAPIILESLLSIGCPRTAQITKTAIEALHVQDLSVQTIEAELAVEDDGRDEELHRCDGFYYQAGEDIECHLFAFVGANKHAISL